jgi:hypothetical protein
MFILFVCFFTVFGYNPDPAFISMQIRILGANQSGSRSWSDFEVTKKLNFYVKNILTVGNGSKNNYEGTKAFKKSRKPG